MTSASLRRLAAPASATTTPSPNRCFVPSSTAPRTPRRPFVDLAAAQQWVDRFVRWYNTEHLHSAIRFVTPDARHFGQDTAQFAKRRAVYAAAQAKHPERWSQTTRNWDPILVVTLNPERESVHSEQQKNAA